MSRKPGMCELSNWHIVCRSVVQRQFKEHSAMTTRLGALEEEGDLLSPHMVWNVVWDVSVVGLFQRAGRQGLCHRPHYRRSMMRNAYLPEVL